MKKLFTTTLLLCLSILSIAQYTLTIDDVVFENGVITDYTGTAISIIIPDNFNGEVVTEIGERAFEYKQLRYVKIPISITTLSRAAFYGNSLNQFLIPNSVTTIEMHALGGNQLRSIILPNSLTYIGVQAFSKNLVNEFRLPYGTEGETFQWSNGRKSGETIDANVYAEYTRQEAITQGPYTLTIDDVVFENGVITDYLNTTEKDIIIPDNFNGIPVTEIGSQAFLANQLTSVTIPNSVTSIGGSAFSRNQLTSVIVGNSVTTIGQAAFYGSQLTSIEIPNSVTTIGNSAFNGNQFTEFMLPENHQGAIHTWSDDEGNTYQSNDEVTALTKSYTMGAVVTPNDLTPPVVDETSYEATLTFECSGTTPNAPRANDEVDGIIIGTTSTEFPVTESTEVTWTFSDASGNTSETTQNIIIEDLTAPTPDVTILEPIISGSSFYTAYGFSTSAVFERPTATDNCQGEITGSLDQAVFPMFASSTVTWTYTDKNGNTSSQTQEIIIDNDDVLEDVTSQCALTSLETPDVSGVIEGYETNDAVFPINESTTITWIFTEFTGYKYSLRQRVIINEDKTAPAPDVASLEALTFNEQITELPSPSATDNCSGDVVVTNNASFPITETTTITWTYTDNTGNVSTQTQQIIINNTSNDDEAPVVDQASYQSELTFECSGSTPNAPTANDVIDGIIIGTTTTQFPVSENTVVTWSFTDNAGNTSTTTQNIVINDVTAPTPDVAQLASITAECSVTNLVAPTATDNCSGDVTVSHDAILPITKSTTVTWTYTDASGNNSTQQQQVVINDKTAPVVDASSFEATLTFDCSGGTPNAPRANDNCDGSIIGTTTTQFPVYETTEVTWSFTDNAGNTSTAKQNIIIEDITAPTPDVAILEAVIFECQADKLSAQTATDNCNGNVTVTNDAVLPITKTTTITWTYTDDSGNTSTQSQEIVINDNTAPIVDASTFDATLTFECSGGTPNAPRANDNCDGIIIGTTTTQFPVYETTEVTWSFTDNTGNTSTTTQSIVIEDKTAPTPDVALLEAVQFECQIDKLSTPSATDNCDDDVTITNDATFPITETTSVTWTYEDGSGNKSMQVQEIVIKHTTAPVVNMLSLESIMTDCQLENIEAPTATTACGQTIDGVANISFPILDTTIHEITWVFTDASNKTISQTQTIEWIATPQIEKVNLSSNMGEQTVHLEVPALKDFEYQWIDCDRNNTLSRDTNKFTPNASGHYKAILNNENCLFETECINVELVVNNLSGLQKANDFRAYPNPTNELLYITTDSRAIIYIYNMSGSLVVEAARHAIDVSDLETGVYIIKQENKTTKFVKQ